MRSKVLVVLGPTATGKSDIAIQIAKKCNGEIISADSRQVYKRMNLGSGKITKKEMVGVPHHLLDVVKPSTRFSVAHYKKLAEKAIEKIISHGKLPIICGGTGFYIDSIAKNILLPEVSPNQKLRKILEKKSAEKLFKKLKKLSPSRAKSIDRHNKVRLIRAIEIAKSLGNIPKIKELPSKYDFIFIGLDLPDKELEKRIEIRLLARIKKGMIKEVENLHKQDVSRRRLESFGLEYRQTALYLQGKITLKQMIENIKNESWQYVKRQRTWFKRNKQIKWFEPKEIKKILSLIKNKILKS